MASFERYIWTKSLTSFNTSVMPAQAPDASLLSDLSSLRYDWLRVYHGQVPVTETWSRMIPVPAGVFFVIKGHGRLEIGGVKTEVPAGSAFLAAPGLRRQWFAEGTLLLSVAFRAVWPDGRSLFSKGLDTVLDSRQSRSLKHATSRLHSAIHGRKREVTYVEASRKQPLDLVSWCAREAAFREWFVAYVKTLWGMGIRPMTRQTSHDARLQEILHRLDSWPLHQPLDCHAIVEGLKLGTRRMEQLLATGIGQTPHGYLNLRRLDNARLRLADEDGSLKELAFALGFRHASHFTVWFKRCTGMTPGAYRSGSGQGAV